MTWDSRNHRRSKNGPFPSSLRTRACQNSLVTFPHMNSSRIISPQNMIGQSQSGTGKTAAFVLTMLSRVDFSKNRPQVRKPRYAQLIAPIWIMVITHSVHLVQALCLAPSRELARQIMSVVVAMGKFTQVQTEYAIKDNLPKGATKVTAQIIVGTPGTMTDLIRRKVIDASEVKVFVLDEADNMLDQDGLGDQTLRVKKFVLMLITSPVKIHGFTHPTL